MARIETRSPRAPRSPEVVKMSRATGISLGLLRGRMYRGAVNRCVNLLVHYEEGCSANCAYCGLAGKRPGAYAEKSFIHVDWPVFTLEQVIEAIVEAPPYVRRTCISMITNGRCREDTEILVARLRKDTPLPISVLVAPTVLRSGDLESLKAAGADKIGVALDLATPALFDLYRGKGVGGPHRWAHYWEILEEARNLFGPGNVGAHLMVGMGETEEEMIALMDRLCRLGVVSHLFAFFAEKGSVLSDRAQPPWESYLRVQLARYLLEEGLGGYGGMVFDGRGQVTAWGLPEERMRAIVATGRPFMTTGCLGSDGTVACNRPFGNCLPDPRQWNYPYLPNEEERSLLLTALFPALERPF